MSLSAATRSPQDLLAFYEQQHGYYRHWARAHRHGYWILFWLLITGTATVAAGLLFRLDPLFVAGSSLGLNVLLIASRFIDSENKWARYRTTELRIAFALQEMRAEASLRVAQGSNHEIALLEAIQVLHAKVELLVMEEFSDFFAKVKSLQEIDSHIMDRKSAERI